MAPRPWSRALVVAHFALALLAGRALAQEPGPEPGQNPPEVRPQDPPQDPPEVPPQEPPREEPAGTGQEPAPLPPKIDLDDIAARAAQEAPEDAADEAPEEPSIAVTWTERLARDKRITFSARSATDASAVLERAGGMGQRRAAAWMTLGCAGSPTDRHRIASEARGGKGLERNAAILAVGEASSDETQLLSSIAGQPDALAAECAMMALLRSRRPPARERVEAIARDEKEPHSAAAAALLAFDRDPSAGTSPRAARMLVDLRWEAARVFGGVDGRSFTARRIAELADSRTFYPQVVLRAAARLPGIAAKDHLLSVLIEGEGNSRLVAMVDASPRALSRLVDSDLWAPRDTADWSVLLSEIERERAEASCTELLGRAAEIRELAWTAKALLARADRADIESFGSVDLPALDVKERVLACDVLGSIDDEAARAFLVRLGEDPKAAVRGAALVARLRLGDPAAELAMEPILADRNRPEHTSVLESLCRSVREPQIAYRLERYMRKAVGADLATVAAALCAQNRTSGRAMVRSLLSLDSPPTGARRLRLVRALCRRPTAQDLEVLSQLFPQPGEEELNLELAVALTILTDPAVRPILRSGLWRSSFDEGVLSGMLLLSEGGVRGMIEEIERPPHDATTADFRRAGFALGEWGGFTALNALVQDRSAASPEAQGALLGVLGARTQ